MLHHPTVGSLDLSDLSPGGWRYEALFDRYVTTSGFKTETLMRPFGEVPNYFKQNSPSHSRGCGFHIHVHRYTSALIPHILST